MIWVIVGVFGWIYGSFLIWLSDQLDKSVKDKIPLHYCLIWPIGVMIMLADLLGRVIQKIIDWRRWK